MRFLKKDKLGSDLGQVSEQCPEKVPFRAVPGVENDVPVDTGAQFPLFAGTSKMLPKWSQKGSTTAPKSDQRRPKVVPRAFAKKGTKKEYEF